MPIERPYVVCGKAVAKQSPPLIQAAPGGGRRILRAQGQQHNLVALRRSELGYGFAGKAMPVAHSHKAAGVETLIFELNLQRPRLLIGETPDGRTSANGCVMMLHFTGASGRNQFSERFTAETGEGKVNDIGGGEEAIKKGLYRSQRIRPAQLKQNYPHTARCLRHPFRFPRTGEFTPI